MADRSTTRRDWLRSCVGVTGAIAVAGCAGGDDESETGESGSSNGSESSELGSDWPMYGVDLQNTGYHPNAIGPDSEQVSAREVYDLGGGGAYPVIAVDDRLYATGWENIVIALDLQTEELLWEAPGHGPLMAFDDTIYGPRASHSVYSYDMETGDRWESDEIELDGGPNLNNEPIPTEHGVFVISENNVWNVDPETGAYTSVRQYPRDSRDLVGTTDFPAYHDGVLYHAMGIELYALNVETGEHEWMVEGETVFHTKNPAVNNGRVYVVGGEGRLYAYDAHSGEEIWSITVDTSIETSPAVADGTVYFVDNDRAMAVDADSGEIDWEIEQFIPASELVIVDDLLYMTHSFGLTTIDRETGDIRWEFEFEDGFTSPPTIVDETVYAISLNDRLYAIEPSS